MDISEEKLKRIAGYGRFIDRENPTREIEKIAGLYPRGFMSIVASQAGTGKTWLTQYICCQLSRGGRILDGMVARSPRYKSVIMSGETGAELLDLRLKSTCWDYVRENMKTYSAVEMMTEGEHIYLNTQEGQETAAAIFYAEHPDIVFYDTLISWHSMDESKQAEMTGVYTFLLRMAKAFNCAVVVNHHTRKRPANMMSRKPTQEDVIGSSAGVRLAATVYTITAEDEDAGLSKMTVSNVKSWYAKTPPFTYKFIRYEDSGLLDFVIDFDTEGKNIFWSLRERCAELVRSYEAGTLLEVDNVAVELKTSPDSARRYLEELTKQKRLQKVRVLNNVMYKVIKNAEAL